MSLSSISFAAVTLVALAVFRSSHAFVVVHEKQQRLLLPVQHLQPHRILHHPLAAASSSSNNPEGDIPKSSRLEGNFRTPTEDELELMDEMIDKLADAKPYELPNAVRKAFRVISSPQFFLRIASRTDEAATDVVQREKLSALAANLVNTLEAVVSTTEEQLDERSQEVQRVVKAAAEPDSGEFLVPLLPERIAAMRNELEGLEESSLDEGFLSTLDSWMNKSHQDGMDLMVGILQKVLQMYAGTQILRARQRANDNDDDDDDTATAASKLFDKLLQSDADTWDAAIVGSKTDLPALMTEVQRTTETIVLSLEAGSMAQRVQAEYMQELMKRVEAIQQQQQ